MQAIFQGDNEEEIYTFLLRKGVHTVNQLSKMISIDRRTLYDILRRMEKRGLVVKNAEKVSKYSANSPEIISYDINQKINELKKIRKDASTIETNNISVYEGAPGVKTIISEIIENRLPHYAYGLVDDFLKVLPSQVQIFVDRLSKLNLPEEIIYNNDYEIKKVKNGKYKQLPVEKLPPYPTVIYRNTVAMLVSKPSPKVIIIRSKNAEKEHLNYFRSLWKL